MFLLSVVVLAGCVVALAVLASSSGDGREPYWRLAHLLLVPPAVIGVMYLSSFLGHRPLTVDEARAQIAATPTVALATPTDTPLPVAPTPTSTAVVVAPTATATATGTATSVPSPMNTPVPAPTPIATPNVVLPPLKPHDDAPGARTSQAITAAAGGNASTTDGRVDLYFPAGAVGADATVTVDTLNVDAQPVLANHRVIGEWRFSAATVQNTPVTMFAQPVTALLRASSDDLRGVNPRSLRLWTLNEASGQMGGCPGIIRRDAAARCESAALHHQDVNELANMAFLSKKPNIEIGMSTPSDYLETIPEERLRQQFIPMDRGLWSVDRFQDFLAARRDLLADGINEFLRSL